MLFYSSSYWNSISFVIPFNYLLNMQRLRKYRRSWENNVKMDPKSNRV